jgi:hypothetical protein
LIFEFNSSCFRGEIKTLSLLAMANMALKGRHRLYISDEDDHTYLAWLGSLGTSLEEQWRQALDTSMDLEALAPAPFNVTVCEDADQSHDPKNLVLGIREAERLTREPFRVYVENDDADRDFLLTFSNQEQAKKIAELEDENLLSFEHCGGISELRKKVRTYTKARATNFLNCTAVFDSDAPSSAAISQDASHALERCRRLGLHSFMLKRRAIENYLMRDWLKTWVNNQGDRKKIRIFECFARMSLEQRSHFHMKRGLKADQAKIDDGTITLYAGVAMGDLGHLNDGFGSSLSADLYAKDWIQSVQSVDDADAWEEVNGMVNKILVLCR